MAHPKRVLQDAEEAFGFGVQFVEVERLGHEGVGAGLKNLFFALAIAADGDDDGLIRRVVLNTAADFNSVHTGNHDIENQEIGFDTANFDQCRYAVGRR